MSQRDGLRWVLGVTGFLLLGAVEFAAPAAADLRTVCLNRCRMNKVICTDSTLQGGGSTGAGTGCEGGCVDDYISCGATCTANDPRPACGLACSSELSSCAASCRPAGNSTAACNDAYVSCRDRCEAAPRCTHVAHCNGQVCQDGTCVQACKSNAWCQTRMGPDALCITTGPHKGKCMKS